MTTIRELQERAYRQSADKGFHDDEEIIDFLHEEGRPEWAATVERWRNGNRIALQHSELSEALEEMRTGSKPTSYTYYNVSTPTKPEGVPSEMADVVIRVLDFCGANGIDLEAIVSEKLDYNATRSHKHGKNF